MTWVGQGLNGPLGLCGQWGRLQLNATYFAYGRRTCIISGADALVRCRPPGRLFDGGKRLIPLGKSGTRASRADQGVRPTINAEFHLFGKVSDIGLQPSPEGTPDFSPPAAGSTSRAGGRTEAGGAGNLARRFRLPTGHPLTAAGASTVACSPGIPRLAGRERIAPERCFSPSSR